VSFFWVSDSSSFNNYIRRIAMLRRKSSTLCLLWIILTLCLPLSFPAHANDGCPISIPTSPGNVLHNTCESTIISWNNANSATDLARNSWRVLTIIEKSGKGEPYTWSVSGKGFSLENTEPTGISNTLYTDGTACGSAIIKVTGCNGKIEVTGYVRSTAGKWILQPYDTPWPYAPATAGTVIGKYRITGTTMGIAVIGLQYPNCISTLAGCQEFFASHFSDYDGSCSNPPYVLGCTNALNWNVYPDISYPEGTWPKYWKACQYGIDVFCGPHYRCSIVWMQSQFRVSIWECP
jgi:hypothetical protein